MPLVSPALTKELDALFNVNWYATKDATVILVKTRLSYCTPKNKGTSSAQVSFHSFL